MRHAPLGNRDLMRALNRSTVLNTIKTHGPIARTDVARRSGLSPATVTGLTADLIAEGLIFEKEAGDSSGGRRPILLALNPAGGAVVGMKLTETHAIGALTDLEASVIARRSAALPDHAPETVAREAAALVRELLKQAGVPREKLLGVGVGLAGLVDSQRGVLRQSPFLGWEDLPLRDLLQTRLRVPVYVDNDVNTLTVAEKWFGAGQGVRDFLVVTVGRGIGLGIVVNGQFYRGSRGGAGELGHTVVDPDGRRCACGKRGCLETLAGEPGLLQTAAERAERGDLPRVDSINALLALAEQGQPAAQQILADAGRLLGRSLANLIQIFNPQRMILGGEGVRLGRWLLDPLFGAAQTNAAPILFRDMDLRVEPWGDEAWARGAASLVLRELFESPMHQESEGAPAGA